jgi:hypothetical protein
VLAGYPDPRRSYGSKDLDNLKKQIALPVRPVQYAIDHYNIKGKLLDFAIADLLTIALFLLLRSGKYTMPTSRSRPRTVLFQ